MKAILTIGLLLLAVPAWAVTVTPSGTTADVIYTEPSTNADGSPLTDLDHCNVYAKPTVGTEIKFENVPASKLAGGAPVRTPITVAGGSNYVITVSCTDKVGNESKRSVSVLLDGLAPAEPK